MAEWLEHAIGKRGNIGCETNAQEIEGVDCPAGVREPNQVNGTPTTLEQGPHRSFRAIFGKIAQEGIASAEREETKRDSPNGLAAGKNAVEDFVRRSVAANGKKMAVTLIVSLARKLYRVALAGGCNDVNAQSLFAQARKCRAGEFCGTTATGGGVHDGEETIHLWLRQTGTANSCSTHSFSIRSHKCRIAEALSRLARRSARTFLLIFKEAVRGKSSSRTTTPWIRL